MAGFFKTIYDWLLRLFWYVSPRRKKCGSVVWRSASEHLFHQARMCNSAWTGLV